MTPTADPRPTPDLSQVREAMADLAANEEPEAPPAEEPEADDAAEELDLDLPPNESAPGHNPDGEEGDQ